MSTELGWQNWRGARKAVTVLALPSQDKECTKTRDRSLEP
jgi:hypothetical protein